MPKEFGTHFHAKMSKSGSQLTPYQAQGDAALCPPPSLQSARRRIQRSCGLRAREQLDSNGRREARRKVQAYDALECAQWAVTSEERP